MATPHYTVRPVYIYALCEPDAPWNVRYIGKVRAKLDEEPDRAIKRRLSSHLWDSRNKRTHRYNWVKSVLALDKLPIYRLLDITDDSSWQDLEKFYISSYLTAGFALTNLTYGGDGVSGYVLTPEQRLKLSRAKKGKKPTDAWRALVSKIHRERCANNPKTHCKRGHEYTVENTYVYPNGDRRTCRICLAIQHRRNNARSVALRKAQRATKRKEKANTPVTHCKHGHEFTPENTYIDPQGRQRCRTCRSIGRQKERQQQATKRAARQREEALAWISVAVPHSVR